MPPQQPIPTPVQPPIIVKSEHSVWFYILLTILSIMGIAIVLFVAAFVYHEMQLQQARQQLQTAEQQVQTNEQQIQDAINGSSGASAQNTATTSVNSAPIGNSSATIDTFSLATSSSKPTITGTAINVSDLNVSIGDNYYDPPVVNGKWSVTSAVTLAPGSYAIVVKVLSVQPEKLLTTGTLIVK